MPFTVTTSSGSDFVVDWPAWRPADTAVLTFIRRDGQLLLILKKRGLGRGKVNAPGGRIEPGETPEQAAVRETQEEVGLTPLQLHGAGRLDFAFADGYSLRCHVYTAASYEGVPTETKEAIPLWIDEREMPYGQMWADDRLWFPLLQQGRKFSGRFLFDEGIMLGCELDVEPPAAAAAAG